MAPASWRSRRCLRAARALVAACALCAGAADAFEVRPLVHGIESVGRSSSSSLVVTNDSDVPLPVEFVTSTLEYDGTSARRGASADDELLVFPPIAVVPPGGMQAVRVQWLGDPAPETARSFIVSVEQLPVPDAQREPGSGVQVLLTFNVYVHVSPPGARPVFDVSDRRVENRDGRSVMHLRLANRGTGIGHGSLLSFELEGDGRRASVLPGTETTGPAELFLPPGYERDVELSLPGDEWPADTSLGIGYDG